MIKLIIAITNIITIVSIIKISALLYRKLDVKRPKCKKELKLPIGISEDEMKNYKDGYNFDDKSLKQSTF